MIALTGGNAVLAIAAIVAIGISSQILGLALQTRLMDLSPTAPSLGAALCHSALNLGNATGACLGGPQRAARARRSATGRWVACGKTARGRRHRGRSRRRPLTVGGSAAAVAAVWAAAAFRAATSAARGPMGHCHFVRLTWLRVEGWATQLARGHRGLRVPYAVAVTYDRQFWHCTVLGAPRRDAPMGPGESWLATCRSTGGAVILETDPVRMCCPAASRHPDDDPTTTPRQAP